MIHALLLLVISSAVLLRGQSRQIQAIPFIILGVIASVRYGFGNDYFSYQMMYKAYQAYGPDAFGGEYLYGLINCASPSYHCVVALTSVAFVLCVYLLISKNLPKRYIVFGLFVFLINPYLFLMNLSAVRQCMAMILFIAASYCAFKRQPVAYFALVAIASSFHHSALMLLPFYFVANAKPMKGLHVLVVLLAAVGMVVFLDLAEFALYLGEVLGSIGYEHYLEDGSGNSLRATLLTGIYFIYVACNLPRLKGFHLVCAKLYLVGLILGVFAYDAAMFTRYQMYFDIFSVVALPAIFLAVQSEGKIVIAGRDVIGALWSIINRYALPSLIIAVYLLRYYSFFSNPLWDPFAHYSTIFGLL